MAKMKGAKKAIIKVTRSQAPKLSKGVIQAILLSNFRRVSRRRLPPIKKAIMPREISVIMSRFFIGAADIMFSREGLNKMPIII